MTPLTTVLALALEFAVIFGVSNYPSMRESARLWWRRRPRPEGPLRTVRGTVRGRHRPSPFEHMPCLFSWVRIEKLASGRRCERSELAVGRDFVLDSPEGTFTVRIDGLQLHGHPPLTDGGVVVGPQPGELGQLLAVFDPMQTVLWSEFHVRDGDEIEVTGVCREEPALPTTANGLRDVALAPTLTGAGGRLDVRFLA